MTSSACDCSDSSTGGSGGTGTGGTGGSATGGTGATGGVAGEGGTGGEGGTAGAAGTGGGDIDVCPGEEIVLTGSGTETRTGSASGDTTSLNHNYTGTCGSSTSSEAVYFVIPDVDGRIRVDLGGPVSTNFDAVLYARTECDVQNSEIACHDSYEHGAEIIEFDAEEATPYYIFVDGYSVNKGPYTVNVQLVPKGCGNGILEPGEECDDGNDIDDDWCRNDCTINPNPSGNTCPGTTMAMTGTGTNNRVGTIAGSTANFTANYTGSCATNSASGKDFVAAVTSDVTGTMNCDLGGSSSTPWDAVLYVRSTCTNATSQLACNNAYANGADKVELQVAGNTTYYVFVDGNGATHSGDFVLTCIIKPAYCGNGVVEGTEECDDGNNENGDGCDENCKIEPQGPADVCPGMVVPLIHDNGTFIAYVPGSTTGQTSAYAGSCGSSGTAPDQVYQFNSGPGGNVTVSLPKAATNFDSVLYVREGACFGPGAVEVACKDIAGDGGEIITFQAPPNKNYWVFVDGWSGRHGNFALQILVEPTCGNGVLDIGEECDDGNKTPGDGCDENCKIEAACGNLSEVEDNSYTSPNLIPAACGTFQIYGSISPVGDTDYFRFNGLSAEAKIEAYAYVGSPGTCTGGAALVLSAWQVPISGPGTSFGPCPQTGAVACSSSASDGNCAKLSHTVGTSAAGDYAIKVHGLSTVSTVDSYGLIVTVR